MASVAAPRYVVAETNDWSSLIASSTGLEHGVGESCRLAVLAPWAAFDAKALPPLSSFLNNPLRQALIKPAKLSFLEEPKELGCADGQLVHQIARRIDQGISSFAEALSLWMMKRQAERFADDIRQGRLLLWVNVATPEQERQACMSLLAAKSGRVEVHDLAPVVRPG